MIQRPTKPDACRRILVLALLLLATLFLPGPARAVAGKTVVRTSKRPASRPAPSRPRAVSSKFRQPRSAASAHGHLSPRAVSRGRSRAALQPAAPPAPRITPAAIEEILAEPQPSPFLYPHNLDPLFHILNARQAEQPAASDLTLAPTIRILQFGDSHTAADLFTGALRSLLQSRFGNGGLGFQYPGHPFAGYHLVGSTRTQTSGWFTEGNKFTQLGDGDLGLGGISLSTTRPGESIQLIAPCTTFQVHYLIQPGGGSLRFTDNGTYISDIDTSSGTPTPDPDAVYTEPPPTPARRAGTLTYACTAGDHDLRLTTLDRAPVRLLGLVTESPGITYECLGINGAVAPLMLRWNQGIFADYLRQRDPSLIVLAYGTNEAAVHSEDYLSQFKRLLVNLHTYVPKAAILVLGPYDRATRVGRGRRASWQTFAGTERIIEEQREACREEHCAFYDERRRMGGPGAMIRWASASLAQADHTHLTGTGYRDLAEALYRDLLAAYQTYQQASSSARKPVLPHPLQSIYRPPAFSR